MTESRRLAHLKERAEQLRGLKRDTRLSHLDLLGSNHFLRYWISAYHLGHIIVRVQDADKHILILGPLWDFLKEHDIEISGPHERKELIIDYIRSRHSF